MTVDEVMSQILKKEPATSLMPVKEEWLAAVDEKYPGMPDHLRRLYSRFGYGSIGESRYMIHCLLEPSEIYDPVTAEGLSGILIVGDDFAGNCEAYDAANSWRFGSIEENGEFEPYGHVYSSFVAFLRSWFVDVNDTQPGKG